MLNVQEALSIFKATCYEENGKNSWINNMYTLKHCDQQFFPAIYLVRKVRLYYVMIPL